MDGSEGESAQNARAFAQELSEATGLETVLIIFHQPWNSVRAKNYNSRIYSEDIWDFHFHKNFELIYVWEGELLLTVNGKSEKMSTGNYALILPNQIHAFDNISDSKAWVAVFKAICSPFCKSY